MGVYSIHWETKMEIPVQTPQRQRWVIMGHGEERCPKYPSMLKAYCSHCQGLERGTADNPQFSLKEDHLDGWPVVEVLKNGGPVGWWDGHFQFGQRKAEMLVACMDILRKFWLSTDDERRAFAPQLVENERRGLRIQVSVEMHPNFELSTGPTIDRPYLLLRALPPDDDQIGLGVTKCRAICAVEEHVEKWLVKQQVRRLEERVKQLPRKQGVPD